MKKHVYSLPLEHRGPMKSWYDGLLRYWEWKRMEIKGDRGHPDANDQSIAKRKGEVDRLNWETDADPLLLNALRRVSEHQATWEAVQGPHKLEIQAALAAKAEREKKEPEVKGSEGGPKQEFYTTEAIMGHYVDLAFGNPTVMEEKRLQESLTHYFTQGNEEERSWARKTIRMITLLTELQGNDPLNAETSLALKLDRDKLVDLLGDRDLIVGIKCGAQARGINVDSRGEVVVDRSSREYQEYHRLRSEEIPGWGLEIRKRIARELGESDPNSIRVRYAFAAGAKFMQVSRLDEQLIETYEIVNTEGGIDQTPGYFHPLVNKSVWELMHVKRAAMETIKKATPTSKILNREFFQDHLERSFSIGGKDWKDVLIPPIELESMLFAKDVLENKVSLVARVWQGTEIRNQEIKSGMPLLAEVKRRGQMQANWRQFVGGEMPKLMKKYPGRTNPQNNRWAKAPYLLDFATETARILDEMGMLSGGEDPLFNKLMTYLMLNSVGLNREGVLEISQLGTAKMGTDLSQRHTFEDPKSGKSIEVNLATVGEWILASGTSLKDLRPILDRPLGVATGDTLKMHTRDYYLENPNMQDFGRRLAWGKEVDTAENMMLTLGNKARQKGADKRYNKDEAEKLFYMIGWD